MAKIELDKLDHQILGMLAENARKPYLEIARECGVSGAAIHQRIQKLYSCGVIKGSVTLINPLTVGYQTCAYIGLSLKEPSKFEKVVDALLRIPEVVECHYTTGPYDFFAKIYARNNEDLLRIIHDNLRDLADAKTESMISFKEVVKRQVPIIREEDD